MIWTHEELQKEIIRVLKENDGEMKQEELCDILGIVQYDIPWGYNIGWAKCLQTNQKYHLILSGENEVMRRRSKNIPKKNRKKLNRIDKKEDALLGASNVVTTKHFRHKQKMGAASKVRVYTKEEIDAYEEMRKE